MIEKTFLKLAYYFSHCIWHAYKDSKSFLKLLAWSRGSNVGKDEHHVLFHVHKRDIRGE